MKPTNFNVELFTQFDVKELGVKWQTLEKKTTHRFFMSWYWIQAWLISFSVRPVLVEVKLDGSVVGLALVCLRTTFKHGCLPVRQCAIQESGNPLFDQQWIEYNQLLIDDQFTDAVAKRIVRTLVNDLQWDELLFGVATEQSIQTLSASYPFRIKYRWSSESHGIELNKIRETGDNYISTLSKNTRAQIRRSIKEFEKRGPIVVEHAASFAQAKEFLAAIAPMHKAKWGTAYQQSGFANAHFCEFHNKLIELAWPDSCVDLIKVRAGDTIIAYLYNFKYQNRVYFYLSAVTSFADNKLRPGLTSHALCIQEYLDDDYEYYDFMGGGEAYKDRLASKTGKFHRVTFQQPRLKLKIEDKLRDIKVFIKNKLVRL